ncbi:MAG: hypothetical protein IIB99_05865 [Planctomycetes bacterium]|nr:hypothetical protein [Planctomycetota bacterium]MCH8210883.1 hypothetical protein [Planctomycetota bacterium]
MRFTAKRIGAATTAAMLVMVLGGCYEEISDSPTAVSPPDAPPSSTPISSYGTPPQSALGGAKRAAENTRDRVAEYQRRLEQEMEDN